MLLAYLKLLSYQPQGRDCQNVQPKHALVPPSEYKETYSSNKRYAAIYNPCTLGETLTGEKYSLLRMAVIPYENCPA
jgi:hypothetical protein